LGGSDDIFIEAKLNLTTENEFKRLLGQIQLMKPRENSIIVILFGETKPEYIARLRDIYPSTEDSVVPPFLAVIEKPVPKPLQDIHP
jgi:hypothetical protein